MAIVNDPTDNPAADDLPEPGDRRSPGQPSEIELVCANCGHSFTTPMSMLADPNAELRCLSCRKPFKMNQRFHHDALDDLDKRRRIDPIDRVWADLGKIVGD